MKKNQQLMQSLSIIGIVLILSMGGCKKELESNTAKLDKTDLLMSKEAVLTKKMVFRQSPGLKIKVTGKTIKRISPTLKSIDKISKIFNEEQSKNNQNGLMTARSANFTASLAGTYYNCYAELNQPGPYDWYLINWNTGVYTYIGSSTDYITFNVQKPSMYGNYRVWGEGPYGAGFTGFQNMGDPYTGVSMNSGILSFTNLAAYKALEARLESAYEAHQTFLDQYGSMSDDDADAAAITAGFDEFLPFKEFEAHFFGRTSLRAQIQREVDYWYTQTHTDLSGFPADNYIPYTYEEQTLMTSGGQIEVGGVGEGPFTLPTVHNFFVWRDPVNPGANSCVLKAIKKDNENYASSREIKKKVYITQNNITSKTSFVANIQTLKKQALFNRYYPSLQKQRVRVHGNYYNSNCASQTAFDSGLTNSSLKYRYSQRTRHPLGTNGMQSKSNEFALQGVIGSNSYTLTYTH